MQGVAPDVSKRMSRIRSKNTTSELIVRRAAHSKGLRFRLHRKDLPGSPDLVFPRFRAVLFVHGCFWHRHDCPTGRRSVRQNTHFWEAKFERNTKRDAGNRANLEKLGWRVFVIWDCEIRSHDTLDSILNQIRAKT